MAVNAPQTSQEDCSLQFKVRIELRINPKTEAFAKNLKVHAHQGIVTLNGEASCEIDAKNAERVALSAMGVLGVVNNIRVS